MRASMESVVPCYGVRSYTATNSLDWRREYAERGVEGLSKSAPGPGGRLRTVAHQPVFNLHQTQEVPGVKALEPHGFDRRILLAVTALSPQVVIETLYVRWRWMPAAPSFPPRCAC